MIIFSFGCQNIKSETQGQFIDITYKELVNKIENKDTFILQFTKTTCPFCKDLEKIENEYFLNNDEIIFRFFTDLNEKDYNENLNFF